MPISTVEYDALPHLFNPLFRRWLREGGGAQPAGRRHQVVVRPDEIPEPSCGSSLDVRAALCDALETYSAGLGAPPETMQSIARLRDPRACVVITGQQPNLLGGPLLVAYKTATAIALARRLEMRWGRPVVPVFWNHSDDADVEEIRRLHVIDRENKLRVLEAESAPARLQIASVAWRESLPALLEKAWEILPVTPWLPEVRALFEPGVKDGPARWFAGIQLRLFGRHGLIVFEPHIARGLWSDVVAREIRNLGRLQEAVGREGVRLANEGYEPPLDAQTVATLFRVEDGSRRKVRPVPGGVQEDGSDVVHEREEYARLALQRPETFSPGVALRPICQDRIFPTAAYVGGPAEVTYLTQLRGGYADFGLTPPPLVPRMSATLLEPKITKVVEKFRLAPVDLLDLTRKIGSVIDSALPEEMAQRFLKVRHDLVTDLRDLRGLTEGVDANLQRHYRRFAGKIMHGLKELKRRTAHAILEQQEVGRSQIDKVLVHVTPKGQLQERLITLAPYLCLFGPMMVERILEEAGKFAGQHVLIELG